ncbi:MAG: lipopolysaccharide transport periplasmic protein LptA [Alsobacter sp.]
MIGLRQAALLAPLALAAAGLAAGPVLAQSAAKPAAAAPAAKPAQGGKETGKDQKSVVPGFGSNSKEPIQIDADKLEVFSKEQRAVYTGNVIAVQGDTTIKAPTMIVFYERQEKATGGEAKPEGEGEGGGTQLKRVEAKGGVSVVSKDQVATGNEGVFDRAANKIILTGNVALSQGENITKGQKLVYDTETGIAVVESGATAGTPGGRVRGVFVPGNDEKGDKKDKGKAEAGKADPKADPKAKPAKPQG